MLRIQKRLSYERAGQDKVETPRLVFATFSCLPKVHFVLVTFASIPDRSFHSFGALRFGDWQFKYFRNVVRPSCERVGRVSCPCFVETLQSISAEVPYICIVFYATYKCIKRMFKCI